MVDLDALAVAAARHARAAPDREAWLRAFADAIDEMLSGLIDRAEQRAGRAPTAAELQDAMNLPVLLVRAVRERL